MKISNRSPLMKENRSADFETLGTSDAFLQFVPEVPTAINLELMKIASL